MEKDLDRILLAVAILMIVVGVTYASIGFFARDLIVIMYSISAIVGGIFVWAFSDALCYLKTIARHYEKMEASK